MGRADDIEAEFPIGIKMPAELRKLCDFLDQTGYPISGEMRLRPEGSSLKAWFGEATHAWNQLAGFGSGPDGSILAFWMYQEQEASSAPVVHLGSEGNELKVLANNIQDFLRLLGIGYSELGFDDLDAPPSEPETAANLRAWLTKEFGIQSPETGFELVQFAQFNHPDFAQWIHDATNQVKTPAKGNVDAEGIRKRVHAIAESMIRDGHSKVYSLSSPWWSLDFKFQCKDEQVSVSYLDFGKWYPVPAGYSLEEEILALLHMVESQDCGLFELSTCSAGIVTVGPNQKLVLSPPEEEGN